MKDEKDALSFHFYHFVAFYDVSNLDIVEIIDVQTALISGGNFLHIVLKPFQ